MFFHVFTLKNLMIELISLTVTIIGFIFLMLSNNGKAEHETSDLPVINLKEIFTSKESDGSSMQISEPKSLEFYIGLVFILTGSVLIAVRSFVVFSAFLAKLACCVILIFFNTVVGMMLSVLILNFINNFKK